MSGYKVGDLVTVTFTGIEDLNVDQRYDLGMYRDVMFEFYNVTAKVIGFEDGWLELEGCYPWSFHQDWVELAKDVTSEVENKSLKDVLSKDEHTLRVRRNRLLELLRALQAYIQDRENPPIEILDEVTELLEEEMG